METTKPVFTIREIAYVGIFAALIAICSWISIPTPWDIAFTLQTFAVCVVVGLLGMKLGLGLAGIWMAFAMDECLRAIIFWARWKSGRWKDLQTV